MREVPGIAIVAPEHYFDKLPPEQESIQIKLKRKYETIAELLALLFRSAPDGVAYKLDEADKEFRAWLELEPRWSLSENKTSNEEQIKKASKKLENLIDILEIDKNGHVIIIPDTNSLLNTAEPRKYETVAESRIFTFLLLPTVLGELDNLKISHRNPDVREKAKKIIKRIKGWRRQGALTEGVIVDKTITVMSEFKEPDMANTL